MSNTIRNSYWMPLKVFLFDVKLGKHAFYWKCSCNVKCKEHFIIGILYTEC